MNTFKLQKNIAIYSFLILSLFLASVYEAKADGPYGWFIPVAEYVDDRLPANCDPNTHASVEISLVELGTKNPIQNPIGWWVINVNDKNTGSRIASYDFNGQKRSTRICFNPDTQILQPVVIDNNYYNKLEISIRQSDDAYNRSESMKGHHFKGYIQLLPKSAPDQRPFVKPLWPDGDTFEKTPNTFQVATYRRDNVFGAGSKVDTTRLHLINHDTGEYFTKFSKTSGTAEIKNVSAPSDLTSGIYYWLAEQAMDTTISTGKSGGSNWKFKSVPISGMSPGGCFIVDSIPPESFVTNPSETSSDPLSIAFNNIISDIYAGLKSTQVHIEEVDGAPVSTVVVNYDPDDAVSAASPRITFTGLDQTKVYKIYAITTDLVDNVTRSNEVIYDPQSGSAAGTPIVKNPLATNVAETSANLGAEIMSDGGAPVTEHGTCLSQDPDFSTQVCDSNGARGLGVFSYPRSGLDASTRYYFKGYADNSVGRGYSEPSFFTTLTPPGLNLPPTVKFPKATHIKEKSAKLGATITSDGGSPILDHGTCWSLDNSFSSQNCDSNQSIGVTSFAYFRYNLPANTKIYFRGFAENQVGLSYSEIGEFNTLPPSGIDSPPIVKWPTSVNVTDVGADLGATVTEDGGSAITRHGTCWSTDPSFGTKYCDDHGSNVVIGTPYSYKRNGMPSDTLIYFKGYAQNAAGLTGYSGPANFRTLISTGVDLPIATDPELSLVAVPSIVRSGQSTDLEWSMKNIPEELDCRIVGTETFNAKPESKIHHIYDSSLGEERSGAIDSGVLHATQKFTFTCINPFNPEDVYTTNTRVQVIGNPSEI